MHHTEHRPDDHDHSDRAEHRARDERSCQGDCVPVDVGRSHPAMLLQQDHQEYDHGDDQRQDRESAGGHQTYPMMSDSHDFGPQSVGGDGASPWSLSNRALAPSVPEPQSPS